MANPARGGAAEPGAGNPAPTRQATFKLTFANQDLIWHGDPGSPTALVFVKAGAQPIATDFYVTTLTETRQPSDRRYLREARIALEGGKRVVYAFTPQREKVIGEVDKAGHFLPNDFYRAHAELLPTWPADVSTLRYSADENALYTEVTLPGPQVAETLDFLPLELSTPDGKPAVGRYAISYAAGDANKRPTVALNLVAGDKAVPLAQGSLPAVFRRGDVRLGSFDNRTGTYVSEAAYRPGAKNAQDLAPSATFLIDGQLADTVDRKTEKLQLRAPLPVSAGAANATIKIDGNFDDWRNVTGVDDPRGDLVPYLEYIPDVDLLEFKVANDDQHIYLYARVAGRVGHVHPQGGRSYFYAYMDVDQNAGTGFLPTRDDDCYFGVDIGDDCEVQFEFVDNAFRKAFYGFCGLGGDDNILRQVVALGPSQYGRLAEDGSEHADYKAEYTYRNGVTEITEDLKLGATDTITVALSPDGSEVEVVSDFKGFLKNAAGQPTVRPGQTIDLAVGMESDSKAYPGKTRWGADNTTPIRGYQLRRSTPARAAAQ